MTSGAGHFDSLGNPSLKFHLCGIAHEEPGLEFEGIIDTGFTGFIQLPLQHALLAKQLQAETTEVVEVCAASCRAMSHA